MKYLLLLLFAVSVYALPAKPAKPAGPQWIAETEALEAKVCADEKYKATCADIWDLVNQSGKAGELDKPELEKQIQVKTKNFISAITNDPKYASAVAHIKQLKNQAGVN